ncbi:dolichyl-phosphate beta-glucosyltransferase [[Candida] railenensis]|uniref:dolichyl-phosphate beta-glucosyltransferase n=1 Tax=[Candida] railenensis TaxID=45579 RepID=A0A9P0QUT3_9ASCO|nr:dolichyl-phosphate beta-glucosyltransferase [[Candida] railenensis]
MMPIIYLAAGIALIFAAIYGVIIFFSHYPRESTPIELLYITNDSSKPSATGESQATHPLPARIKSTDTSLKAIDGIEISVVIPCYNEVERLGKMLDECVEHLESNYRGKYEILIVDDGSKDGTAQFALTKATQLGVKPHVLRAVQLSKNRGKGGAVTHGLLHTRGRLALFADADGATKFGDVDRMVEFFAKDSDDSLTGRVAIGSRAHMVNTDAVVKRSFIRNFLMYGLHTLVYVFGIRKVQDTQCGFKMFNRPAIAKIFPHMHTERWIFDVEVLLLAELQSIPMKEIAVNWEEIDGSKVDLAKDSIGMAIDLVVTRMAYLMGIYKLNECGRLGLEKKNQ